MKTINDHFLRTIVVSFFLFFFFFFQFSFGKVGKRTIFWSSQQPDFLKDVKLLGKDANKLSLFHKLK